MDAAVELEPAGHLRVEERGGRRGRIPLREACEARLADHTVAQQADGLAVDPPVPADEADVKDSVVCARQRGETQIQTGVERERLLAEDVLAGFERRGDDLFVAIGRRCDDDRVYVVSGEGAREILVGRDTCGCCGRGNPRDDIADSAKLDGPCKR